MVGRHEDEEAPRSARCRHRAGSFSACWARADHKSYVVYRMREQGVEDRILVFNDLHCCASVGNGLLRADFRLSSLLVCAVQGPVITMGK